jgi:hypothetical protein
MIPQRKKILRCWSLKNVGFDLVNIQVCILIDLVLDLRWFDLFLLITPPANLRNRENRHWLSKLDMSLPKLPPLVKLCPFLFLKSNGIQSHSFFFHTVMTTYMQYLLSPVLSFDYHFSFYYCILIVQSRVFSMTFPHTPINKLWSYLPLYYSFLSLFPLHILNNLLFAFMPFLLPSTYERKHVILVFVGLEYFTYLMISSVGASSETMPVWFVIWSCEKSPRNWGKGLRTWPCPCVIWYLALWESSKELKQKAQN